MSILKKIIPSRAAHFLRRLYDRLYDPGAWQMDVVAAYARHRKQVYFVQIGSNNGITGDPLFPYIVRHGWKGVLVEPIPYLFEELKKNYEGVAQGLVFENSAIADRSGTLPFYRLQQCSRPDLPEWYDQIGSFNREVVLKHRHQIPGFDELFMTDQVQALTFELLREKHALQKIDLIHIDTEGYDFEILRSLPLQAMHTELIIFEHKHLRSVDYTKAIRLLKKHAYRVHTCGEDSIAIKLSALHDLQTAPAVR